MNASAIIDIQLESGAELRVPHKVAAPILLRALTGSAEAAVPAAKDNSSSHLEWSHTLCNGNKVAFDEAQAAIAALGEGWRMPSRKELESILDLTRHDPAVDTTRFPDTQSTWYWSSTPCAWNTSAVWVVYFYAGYAHVNHRASGACVRAVRVSPAGQ